VAAGSPPDIGQVLLAIYRVLLAAAARRAQEQAAKEQR
jgi:hypothetical protein